MQLIDKYYDVSLEDLPILAKNLEELFTKRNIICLQGEIGAGKTTLAKQIVKNMLGSDHAISPTFSILNIYNNDNISIYHIDLYRLNDIKEFFDLGLYEYLSDNYVLIEWPELILNYLKVFDFYLVKINIINETKRLIEIWG